MTIRHPFLYGSGGHILQILGLSPGFNTLSKGKPDEIEAQWNKSHNISRLASLNHKCLEFFRLKS